MRTLLAVALFACCLAVGRASTLKAWSGVALSGNVPAPLYRPKHFAFALTCLVGMSFAGRAHSAYSCPNYDDSVSACRDAAAREGKSEGGCGWAFEGTTGYAAGCYCYKPDRRPEYASCCYFGTNIPSTGVPELSESDLDNGRYRPPGYPCPLPPARRDSPGLCPVGFFATARGSTWECTLCKGYELRDGAAERSALPVCPKGQWLQDGCRSSSDVSGLRYEDPSTWPAEHDGSKCDPSNKDCCAFTHSTSRGYKHKPNACRDGFVALRWPGCTCSFYANEYGAWRTRECYGCYPPDFVAYSPALEDNTCKPCTGAGLARIPANSHLDLPTDPFADTCPWTCNDGYTNWHLTAEGERDTSVSKGQNCEGEARELCQCMRYISESVSMCVCGGVKVGGGHASCVSAYGA